MQQILNNNLTPQQNIQELLIFSGYKAKLNLDLLEQDRIIDNYTITVIQLNWIKSNLRLKYRAKNKNIDNFFKFSR